MPQATRVLGGARKPAFAWLAITRGRARGRDFRLGRVTNLGRDAMKNDIVLHSDTVSAEHARIRYEGGRFVLYDLASTNKTKVNGQIVYQQTLYDGDTITVGDTTFVFKHVQP